MSFKQPFFGQALIFAITETKIIGIGTQGGVHMQYVRLLLSVTCQYFFVKNIKSLICIKGLLHLSKFNTRIMQITLKQK